MTQRYIGINGSWGAVVCYDIRERDLPELRYQLREHGASERDVRKALRVIEQANSGFTFSSWEQRMSLVCIGNATSPAELFDTLLHEVKHVVEHISSYYDVSAKSEDAAYLQGEVARQMYLRANDLICPKCGKRLSAE